MPIETFTPSRFVVQTSSSVVDTIDTIRSALRILSMSLVLMFFLFVLLFSVTGGKHEAESDFHYSYFLASGFPLKRSS